MNRRRVRFTKTAQKQVDRERAWWVENRNYPDVFTTELAEAIRVLEIVPGIGAAYVEANVSGLRRLYVRKLTAHLYYTFDDDHVHSRNLGCSSWPRAKPEIVESRDSSG